MSQDKPIKAAIPEPEVVPQAERRQFTAKYKLRILEEAASFWARPPPTSC